MKSIFTRFRLVTLITVLLTLFSSGPLWAVDLDLNWHDTYESGTSFTYDSNEGALEFYVQIYSEAGRHDWVEYATIYVDGIAYINIDSWEQDKGMNHHDGKITYRNNANLWVTNTTTGSFRPQYNDWMNHGFKEVNSDDTYARIRFYLPQKHLNKSISVRIDGDVYDGSGDHWSYDNTKTITTTFTNNPKISIDGANSWNKDGSVTVKLSGVTGTRSGSTYKAYLEATDDGSYYDAGYSTTASSVTTKVSKDILSKYASKQEWADGIRLRWRLEYVHMAQDGRSNEIYTYYSDVVRTPRLSPFNGTPTLSIENRNLKINWDVYTSYYSDNQDPSPFQIERYKDGRWERVATVSFSHSKSSYTYTYPLPAADCNVGNRNFKFRIWRTTFSDPTILSYYQTSDEFNKTFNTNYKHLKFTGINTITNAELGQNDAEVKWDFVSNDGIWDDQVKLQLVVSVGGVVQSTYDPLYNETSCLIKNLKSCKPHEIQLKVTIAGRLYETINYKKGGEDFVAPDILARDITSFETSKGYYNDYVSIKWTVPVEKSNFDYFNITRRSIKTGNEVQVAQINHTGLTEYSIQDNGMRAGEIYQYAIEGYSSCNDKPVIGKYLDDYGFSQPYATVSGRVTYEGDVAVEGVTIAVVGDGEDKTNRSLYFEGKEGDTKSIVKLPAEVIDLKHSPTITFQAWLNPDSLPKCSSTEEFSVIADNKHWATVLNNDEIIMFIGGQQVLNTGVKLTKNQWDHITILSDYRKANECKVRMYQNGEPVYSTVVTNLSSDALDLNDITIGNALVDRTHSFHGYIDEIRFWNIDLTDEQIKYNYNAFLTGREKGLSGYYRCDAEGVKKLFDLSGYKGIYNKHDGLIEGSVTHFPTVPSDDQLANKTVTDHNGNYLLSTVPYTSEGVQYNVFPMMGIHKFSPDKRPIFASPASVTFNDINFEDKSSFEVKGHVYYENTLYPVEGCELYVDGRICTRDNKVIKTDVNGEYTISVPIGDHYIEVRKQGHVFAFEGRYPADKGGFGKRETFEEPRKGLDFYDVTKVTVAGRVYGGSVEGNKPLGLLQSKANIGKAVISIETGYKMNVNKKVVEQSFTYENGTKELKYETATNNIKGKASVGFGDGVKVGQITIETDPETGEFAFRMPPVEYKVTKITIPSNDQIVFPLDNVNLIDATEVMIVKTDSIETESGRIEKFKYNTAAKFAYRTEPSFSVSENFDGSNGEKKYPYMTLGMETPDTVELYTVDPETKEVTYTFGSPIYLQNKVYSMNMSAYEEYVNKDGKQPIYDQVPLQNTIVTITNQFAAGQKVYVEGDNDGEFVNPDALEENQIELDENGKGVYSFMVGFPNIVEPYTHNLNIKYNTNGRDYQWSKNGKFNAIVLGGLASGNNFVTSGPDKILMILRDPAGTGSSSYFEKGVSVTTVENRGGSFVTNNEATTLTKLGMGTTTIEGTPGFGVVTDAQAACDLTVGAQVNLDITNTNETVTTTTTTERISTSDTEDYVGANGDLFIGSATNLIFGKARNVDIRKDQEGQFVVNMEEAISVGENFTTGFKYTQHHIENNLIPNLYLTRNGYIQHVDSYEGIENNTDQPIYVSTLYPTDPRFGSNNIDKEIWGDAVSDRDSCAGPSYHMIPPKNMEEGKVYQDMVRYTNTQIEIWTNTLANNEKAKVDAINDEGTWLQENHSFDAGAIIESSVSNTTSKTHHYEYTVEEFLVVGAASGFTINGNGVAVTGQTTSGGRETGSDDETTEETVTTGYILSEAGYNDALTLDVFNAPDGFGAIFRTRGGQTSCPYEGAVETKYYQPGTEIGTATMQVEIPSIKAVNEYATDVPSGKPANFRLNMDNLSETGDDVWFDLAVLDETNPNGAKLTIDGSSLAKSRPILVPAGKTISKALQLTQTDPSVLDYENIKIVLKSQCQGDPTGNFDVIADTVSLSATFVPSCSDITLQIEDRVLNSYTGTKLPLVVKDFDKSFQSFKGFRIQYKGRYDTDWRLIREYVLNEEDLTDNNELIKSAKITYNFDMSNTAIYPDGEYLFRAITVCQFGHEEINNESEIIPVIKDVARPMLLGNPSPANGILAADGEVSATFNEDIKSSSLSEPVNFIVRGRLNGYRVDHGTALKFSGNEGASTQALIDLNNHPFAFNMWLNVTGDGEILSHGSASNKFVVSVDKAGRLDVTFGGKTYSSENLLPKDKWIFLSISYDSEYHILSAFAASDASTITLIENVAAGEYSGNGIITVGNGLEGSIHELTLWNYARPFMDAQTQMYTAKAPKTPNLIGYWRMDEGHGAMALDLVRNRHISLGEGNVWHIAAKNKAAALDGTAHLAMNTTICSPNSTDDFMFELWFNADKKQGDIATIFSTGHDFGIQLVDGHLVLIGNKGQLKLSDATFNDNAWHHLALNVLRNGMTTVYVDGEVLKQISSVNVGVIASDHIIIGADRVHPADNHNTWEYNNHFVGSVDEIRFWNASLSADFIRNNRYNRITKDAPGLIAYYPFELSTLDEGNQPIVKFDLTDHSVTGSEAMTSVEVAESEIAPGLKAALTLQNVEYGFVADERKVVINLEEAADIIEGTTLEFTLREVKDLNGNMCQPIVWTAYVQRNLLKWTETGVEVQKQDLQHASFSATIVNKSGVSENWSLANVPFWLSADIESGAIEPLGEQVINFSVSDALPIGSYDETIYLIGNNKIYEPFVVHVEVTGNTPEWTVNPEDFELSMNVVGQLKINGKYSENPNDRVAAFIGDRCVGLASPQYYKRYDAYFVMMNIYGEAADHRQPVTFKVWESATGNIYPAVETSEQVTLLNNSLYGSMKNPFLWNATTLLEQQISLAEGWTWVSTYIEAKDNTIASVFANVNKTVKTIKDKTSFATNYNSVWRGHLTDFDFNKMYKVQSSKKSVINVIGEPVAPSATQVTIFPNWNWIGYNASFNTSVADAFAGLAPVDGDLVKSQDAFAIYDEYEWVGTLTTLAPGQGYMYKSASDVVRTFTYPDKSAARNIAPMRVVRRAHESFKPVDNNKYYGNMTLIAVVKDGEMDVTNCEVGVFAGEECRGAIKSETDGLLFLTVAGEGYGERLTIKVNINGEVKTAGTTITYEDDAAMGTIDNPFIIQLGDVTAVDNTGDDQIKISTENGILNIENAGEYMLFNAAGQLIYTGEETKQVLPKGVYMIQAGDETYKVVL